MDGRTVRIMGKLRVLRNVMVMEKSVTSHYQLYRKKTRRKNMIRVDKIKPEFLFKVDSGILIGEFSDCSKDEFIYYFR